MGEPSGGLSGGNSYAALRERREFCSGGVRIDASARALRALGGLLRLAGEQTGAPCLRTKPALLTLSGALRLAVALGWKQSLRRARDASGPL